MSVDTKGLVLTDNKDVFAVCTRIDYALRGMFSNDGQCVPRSGISRIATFDLVPSYGMVVTHFKFRDEDRALFVNFTCDCDAKEYGEHALILSLGFCGSSELIMRTVLAALADLGPAYIDVNDCDDVDYKQIREEDDDEPTERVAAAAPGG